MNMFLAGPTPRDEKTKSWRIEALELLEKYKFGGTVFVPERKDWKVKFEYADQIDWELKGLLYSNVIIFWVPRDLETMPAFTTNVEFGMIVGAWHLKMFYGRPDDSPKNRYLDYLYDVKRPKETIYNNLGKMLKEAVRYKQK